MKKSIIIVSLIAVSAVSFAKTKVIQLNSTHGQSSLGTITAKDTHYGLLLTPNLHGVPAGLHGFHVHENPSCDKDGLAAGGHWDPHHTNKHLGPYNKYGHQGDMPALTADAKGNVTQPVLAPRLRVRDLNHHAFILHAGGDNYSDKPEKLGGGGARIGCAVIR